ncbi:MAG: hypothetical protein LBN95_11680 [Prevotellaceae bacterium]|jgi:hypothetical protein|nr:hypothetical protein [Prevotellaceae bacterium]
MKSKVIYTDAPPEVDEAFDYAVEHNLFLTKEQINELIGPIENFVYRDGTRPSSVVASAPRPRKRFSFPTLKKVAAF